MNILLVEDDPVTGRLIEKELSKNEQYQVMLATTGSEAWETFQSRTVDIVFSDWMIPDFDGLELCKKIRSSDLKGYVYFVLISGNDSQNDIIHGLESGADDYITKPVDYRELMARASIGERIVTLERELKHRLEVTNTNYYQTIRMFINLIEVFNEKLGGHSRRVAEYSVRLAKQFSEIDPEAYSIIETAGLLHDIGMITLPYEFLARKRTELNGEEREMFKSHPIQGEIILQEIDFLKPVAQIVRWHHEQYNGRGFPDGLQGKEIPIAAMIISAASIYDNILYRGKFSLDEVPERLQRLRGYQLEPTVTDALLELNLEEIELEARRKFQEVELDDLKVGMVLARNIRMKSGALAMPIHTQIDRGGITKLKNFIALNCISNKFFIFK
jgi:response regulator RpfG family c-di-GMP phosphodiesterase